MAKLNLKNKTHIQKVKKILSKKAKFTKSEFVTELKSLEIFDSYMYKNTKKSVFVQYLCWFAFHSQMKCNELLWLCEYVHDFELKMFDEVYKDGFNIFKSLKKAKEQEESSSETSYESENSQENVTSYEYTSHGSEMTNNSNNRSDDSEISSNSSENDEFQIPTITNDQLKMLTRNDNIDITKNALLYVNNILSNHSKITRKHFDSLYKKHKKNELMRQIYQNSPKDEYGFHSFLVQTLRYSILKNAITQCKSKNNDQVKEKMVKFICENVHDIKCLLNILKS